MSRLLSDSEVDTPTLWRVTETFPDPLKISFANRLDATVGGIVKHVVVANLAENDRVMAVNLALFIGHQVINDARQLDSVDQFKRFKTSLVERFPDFAVACAFGRFTFNKFFVLNIVNHWRFL